MSTTNMESIKDNSNQKQYEALFDRINRMIHYLHEIQQQNENLTNKIEKIEKVINKQILRNKKSSKKQTQDNKSKENKKDDKSKTIEKVETNTESSSNDTKEKSKVIIVNKIIKPIKNDEKNKIKIIKNQEKVKSTKIKINKEEKSSKTKAGEKEITQKINSEENKSTKIKINKKEKETFSNENKSKVYNDDKINQTIELDEEIDDFEITDIEKNARKQRRILNRQNDINFHIGYMGEAYIYQNLMQMGCFSKIEWNANTKDENNPSVTTRDGSQYFIQEDGEHYDIYAEDYENQKYYFEIKSTNKDRKGNHISSAQKNYFLKVDQKDTYLVLAKVTNVFTMPSIEYCLYVPQIGFKNIEINKEKTEKYFIKKDWNINNKNDEDEETDLIKTSKKQSTNVEKPMKTVNTTLDNKKIKKTTKKKNNQSSMSFLFSKNLKQLQNKEKKKSSSKKINKKTKA